MSTRTRYEVCPAAEFSPGERRIVDVDGLSIGVFNVEGTYHALANTCPHHLGPLCDGVITGEMTASSVGEFDLVREGEVIQCPWHGWKFDIATGESIDKLGDLRTRTFDADVESVSSRTPKCDSPPIDDGNVSESTNGCDRGGDRSFDDELLGDEPPIDTYDVAVEREMVVVYV